MDNEKQLLIQELQFITNKLGRVPTKQELINLTCFSFYLYKKTFGSLNNAIKYIGEMPNNFRYRTKEEITKEIKNVYKNINKKPTIREFAKYSGIAYSTARIAFDYANWDDILKQCICEE